MKASRLIPVVLALTALTAPAAASAQAFEGVLKQHMTTVMPPGVAALAGADTSDRGKVLAAVAAKLEGVDPSLVQTMDITSYVKGAKMRVETAGAAGQGFFAVLDAATDSIFMVIPAMNRVMVGTMDQMGEFQKRNRQRMGMEDLAALVASPTLTELGESTIGGIHARGYRATSAGSLSETWVDPSQKDPDLGKLTGMLQKMNGATMDSSFQLLMRSKGRVLRTMSIMKAPPMLGAGWMVSRIEAAPPAPQAVPDSLFVLPTEYARVNLADMMSSMQ